MNTDESMKYFQNMKREISKTGGLFYQYRPCRRDESTIYDIENIRHNVVYAQTPLNMNDPFDSQIAFSAEIIYDELISMLLEILPGTEEVKNITRYLIKYKLFDKMADFLSLLKQLKSFLQSQQNDMHKKNLTFEQFVNGYSLSLYKKAQKTIKGNFNRASYPVYCGIVLQLKETDITEENLNKIIDTNAMLTFMMETIEKIRDDTYIPELNKLLSKITVSCFSESGWNNPLMWSHYANSYSGFCVEYDFNRFSEIDGLIKKVTYSKIRPTVTLKELGIAGFTNKKSDNDENKLEIISQEMDANKILDYLSSKDECWSYEKEWRIINIEKEPNKPRFINMPKIKSITLGVKTDKICRSLLIDVCQEQDIPCYELVLGKENFSIDRKQLTHENYNFDIDEESRYVVHLANTFKSHVEKFDTAAKILKTIKEANNLDFSIITDIIRYCSDCLVDAYFLKKSIIRIIKNSSELDATNVDEIKSSFLPVEEFILEIRNLYNVLKVCIQNLFLQRKISHSQYMNASKQLKGISSVLDKIEETIWPL